ncbi:MAG: hypothetical protein U5N58_14040 [Actinomycetota bacterium]|nr:hypothetical protein [Actinomycetota bacterium]
MTLFQYKFDTKIGLLYYVWDSNKLLYLGNDIQRFENFKQKAGMDFKQKRFEQLEQEVDSYLSGHLRAVYHRYPPYIRHPVFLQSIEHLKRSRLWSGGKLSPAGQNVRQAQSLEGSGDHYGKEPHDDCNTLSPGHKKRRQAWQLQRRDSHKTFLTET